VGRAPDHGVGGERGPIDPPGGPSEVVVVQEGVDGVLERDRAAGESNNLAHWGLLLGCRSKRGQLEPPMASRQPRSGRRRRVVAAANRPFAAEDLAGPGAGYQLDARLGATSTIRSRAIDRAEKLILA
jgi:hypothetical protein